MRNWHWHSFVWLNLEYIRICHDRCDITKQPRTLTPSQSSVSIFIWHPYGPPPKFNCCLYLWSVTLLPVARSLHPFSHALHAIWFQSFISSLRLISNSPWLRHSIIFPHYGLCACARVRVCVCVYMLVFATLFSRLSRLDWQSNYFPLVSCILFFFCRPFNFLRFILRVLHSSYIESRS